MTQKAMADHMHRISIYTAGTLFYTAGFYTEAQRDQHIAAARTYPAWSEQARIVVTDPAALDLEIAERDAAEMRSRTDGLPDWAPAPMSGIAGPDEDESEITDIRRAWSRR